MVSTDEEMKVNELRRHTSSLYVYVYVSSSYKIYVMFCNGSDPAVHARRLAGSSPAVISDNILRI